MAKKKRATFHDDNEETIEEASFPPSSHETLDLPRQEGGTDPNQLMSQMMQTFQSMINHGALPQQWSSSQPFQALDDTLEPEVISHDVILPTTIERGIVRQEGLNIHSLFSSLFLLTEKEMLGGIPKGCTITLTGPAYSGKTRAALEIIVQAVMQGVKTVYVVAEEGFYDENQSGRNDLFSRFLTVAAQVSGMTEKEFREKHDEDYVVMPNQYHLGKTWPDFIRDYRYVVEDLGCKLTIIDSINMLDPSKLNTVDNLNALKTYNHEKGITCIVIGQVKDTGAPQGGEALFHASEVSLHLYEKTMTSKAQAERWNSNYRDSIMLISAKSKVCLAFPNPIKVVENEQGLIRAAKDQPEDYEFPDGFFDQ